MHTQAWDGEDAAPWQRACGGALGSEPGSPPAGGCSLQAHGAGERALSRTHRLLTLTSAGEAPVLTGPADGLTCLRAEGSGKPPTIARAAGEKAEPSSQGQEAQRHRTEGGLVPKSQALESGASPRASKGCSLTKQQQELTPNLAAPGRQLDTPRG